MIKAFHLRVRIRIIIPVFDTDQMQAVTFWPELLGSLYECSKPVKIIFAAFKFRFFTVSVNNFGRANMILVNMLICLEAITSRGRLLNPLESGYRILRSQFQY